MRAAVRRRDTQNKLSIGKHGTAGRYRQQFRPSVGTILGAGAADLCNADDGSQISDVLNCNDYALLDPVEVFGL